MELTSVKNFEQIYKIYNRGKKFTLKQVIELPFRESRHSQFNACVGKNGFATNETYFHGYDFTIDLLFNNIINNGGAQVDNLIYPLMYSSRHSVELIMKEIIKRYNVCSNITALDINTHSLEILFGIIKSNLYEFDNRFKNSINKINDPLTQIISYDDSGQTYRYASSHLGIRHLVDVGTINVVDYYFSYKMVFEHLKNIYNIICEVCDTVKLDTKTTKLTRANLIKLAKDLPNHNMWLIKLKANDKRLLIKKYGISGKELSKGIDIIKNTHLKVLIGLKPLDVFNERELRQLIVNVKKCIKEVDSKVSTSVLPDSLLEDLKIYSAYNNVLNSKININTIKLSMSLIEISAIMYRPEDLEKIYYDIENIWEGYDENNMIISLFSRVDPIGRLRQGLNKVYYGESEFMARHPLLHTVCFSK